MTSSPAPRSSAKAASVHEFRGNPRAGLPLHPQELALVIGASAQFIFLPWAIGTVHPWAQWVAFVLALGVFGVAVWPRRYAGEYAPGGDFVLHPWSRLLRFPLFWLGLMYLGYVALQGANPAWERVSAPPVWYIRGIEHVSWLPSGITAPFNLMNAWRVLLLHGSAWLVVCALWVGLTRRTALQALLTIFVINGTLIALVGILQRATGAVKILWFYTTGGIFHSTFIYKNHAGAYLNLALATALALAAWHHVRGIRRLERSTPAPVFLFLAIIIAVSVVMSFSRSALLLLAAYAVAAVSTYVVWRLRGPAASGGKPSFLLGVVICAFVVVSAFFLNLQSSVENLERLWGQDYGTITARVHARDATVDLFRDEPLTGWGAGSFRHAFPIHQQNYPEIFRLGGRILKWEYAHNDYVQTLAEVGVLGSLPIVLALGWIALRLLKSGALANPAYVLLTLGLGVTLAHAWVDFPLSNPAVLGTFCALAVLLVRWTELERTGAKS